MENFINNAPFIVVLICLIVGFVFLVKGADMFVEGSSSVAKRFKVPSLIIGLTIVAMGTSLPETAVSVAASHHVDNRIMFSAGKAALNLNLFDDNQVKIAYGIPLSVSGKSPFFDRG